MDFSVKNIKRNSGYSNEIINNGTLNVSSTLSIDNPSQIKSSINNITYGALNLTSPIITIGDDEIWGNNFNETINITGTLIVNKGNSATNINNTGFGSIILKGSFSNSKITTSGFIDVSQATGAIVLNGVTTNIDELNNPPPQ